MTVLTAGHGAADQDTLTRLLVDAEVALVVDVRRSPGSRRHPHVARAALAGWLGDAGIGYRWQEALGGRRSRVAGSPHTALTDPAFQGYADHLDTEVARGALDELAREAATTRLALLCAEADWRRCHRRYLADDLVLRGHLDVRHLTHTGELEPHVPSATARLVDGRVVHDAGAPTLDLDV